MEEIRVKPLTDRQILENTVRIILKYLNSETEEIFLFGSRVSRKNYTFSDFDIGIKAVSPIPFRILQKIEDELDKLESLKSFDLIDFSLVSKEFIEEATKNKRVLYVRKKINAA